MKSRKIAGALVLALTAIVGLGVFAVAAQGPTGVPYLDNQTHTIAAGSTALYRFDYGSDHDTGQRLFTHITMINGRTSGVGFQVWRPELVSNMADNKPIGLGTPQNVDCTTGAPQGSGACLSADLTWSSTFPGSGTYYVLVTNSNNWATEFTLKIQGTGVNLGPAATATLPAPTKTATSKASVAPVTTRTPTTLAVSVAPTTTATTFVLDVSMTPTAIATATVAIVSVAPTATVPVTVSRVSIAPTTTTTVTVSRASVAPATATPTVIPAVVNTDDPGQALAGGTAWTLAANSATWFKFDYALDDGGGRPTKTVTLLNGNQRGISFEVYTGESIGKWWDSKPIGVGTPQSVDCDTSNVVGSGGCQSNNLGWSGTFGGRGTYYVRVRNSNSYPAGLALTIR